MSGTGYCWTCGREYQCESLEHRYLDPHWHVEPKKLGHQEELDKHRSESHDVEIYDEATGG